MKNIQIQCNKHIPSATNGMSLPVILNGSLRFENPRSLNSIHNNPLNYLRVTHNTIRDGHYSYGMLTSKFPPTPTNIMLSLGETTHFH